jgi:hypothetical protein
MNSAPSIAVIGASTNPSKYGNKAVRAYQSQGYQVYPVNPNAQDVEGIPTVSTVRELPEGIQNASVYLPEDKLLPLLPDIAEKQFETVFFNPGSDSPAVVEKAQELGIPMVQACSILAVGQSPSTL